jgi:hypothetical protein
MKTKASCEQDDSSSPAANIDEFLVKEGMRGLPPGKLKQFFPDPDHNGWYMFIFENRSLMCTVPVGLYLGYFVKNNDDSVGLNNELKKELREE